MKPMIKWLNDEVAYMSAPVNSGFLVKKGKAIIVDTGLDKDHGKKILRILEEEGITPIAIINTHSHADHCGGNVQIQKQLDLPVIAPEAEKAFIENPYLEPMGLYGGAHPPAALQNKFLMAKPSLVHQTFASDQGSVIFDEFQVHLIPLPGHSFQQTGVFYAGVLFSADVLLGKPYLDKHLIPFNADVNRHRHSLNTMSEVAFDLCVPAHGEPTEQVLDLIQRNRQALDSIDDWLLEHAEQPSTIDQLLATFCRDHQVGMDTISQYHLYRTAFAAHLTGLTELNRVKHKVEEGYFLWTRVE